MSVIQRKQASSGAAPAPKSDALGLVKLIAGKDGMKLNPYDPQNVIAGFVAHATARVDLNPTQFGAFREALLAEAASGDVDRAVKALSSFIKAHVAGRVGWTNTMDGTNGGNSVAFLHQDFTSELVLRGLALKAAQLPNAPRVSF